MIDDFQPKPATDLGQAIYVNHGDDGNGYEPLIDDDDIQTIRDLLEEMVSNKLRQIMAIQDRLFLERSKTFENLELRPLNECVEHYIVERQGLISALQDRDKEIAILKSERSELRVELCLANEVLRSTVWPSDVVSKAG